MPELNRLTPEEFRATDKLPLTVVLDNIRSQNNIGSIFRTSDAFCIERICLCGITATPPHREIHKTALGAEDTVEWKYFQSAGEAVLALKNSGYLIISMEHTTSSIPLQDFFPPGNSRLAVVFGNEIQGVQDEILRLSDACIEIPQFGTKHSINVSVAAGIALWEFTKKIKNIIRK